jgi:thiol:disulfide interchange protein DsbD
MSTVYFRKSAILRVLCLVLLALAPGFSLAEDKGPAPLTATAQLLPIHLEPHQVSHLELSLHLAEGYKAYSDQFKLKILNPEGFKVSQIEITPQHKFFDKFSKKNRMGVTKSAVLSAVIEAPNLLPSGPSNIEIELTYQACGEGFCLFPEKLLLRAFFQPKPEAALSDSMDADQTFLSSEFKNVFKRGLLWTFIFVFLAGVLTSFTPCIFPMIPITLSVLGRHAHTRTRGQNFMVSNLYVLGIAITYAIMGVVAASTGALFGSFMSHPIVLSIMCVVFLAMALSMFGFYEMEAPAFILKRFSNTSDLKGYSGAFVSGVFSGVVASPCVGPVLVGILTYIAKTQNLWLGFFLMFVYALGMGQLFLILGAFSQATKLLPRSGPWLDGVKHFFGLMMLGVFYYFLGLLLPQRYWDMAFGVGLALTSGYFGAFSVPNEFWKWLRKGLLQALVIVGGAYLVIGIFDLHEFVELRIPKIAKHPSQSSNKWLPYSEQLLEKAKSEKKPVIVDFGANWCAACKELDEQTFKDIRVQTLAPQFLLLRYDATNSSAELDALKEKYDIVGLPTLLFFNSKGELQKDLTLTAFEEAEPFVQRMNTALER